MHFIQVVVSRQLKQDSNVSAPSDANSQTCKLLRSPVYSGSLFHENPASGLLLHSYSTQTRPQGLGNQMILATYSALLCFFQAVVIGQFQAELFFFETDDCSGPNDKSVLSALHEAVLSINFAGSVQVNYTHGKPAGQIAVYSLQQPLSCGVLLKNVTNGELHNADEAIECVRNRLIPELLGNS